MRTVAAASPQDLREHIGQPCVVRTCACRTPGILAAVDAIVGGAVVVVRRAPLRTYRFFFLPAWLAVEVTPPAAPAIRFEFERRAA